MSLSQDVLLCGADRHTPPHPPPPPPPPLLRIHRLLPLLLLLSASSRSTIRAFTRAKSNFTRPAFVFINVSCHPLLPLSGGGGRGGVRQTSSTGNFSLHLFLFSVGAMRVNISRREDAVYFFGGGGGGGPGVVGGCFGRGEQVWGTEFPLFCPVKAQLPARQQKDWQLVWLVN